MTFVLSLVVEGDAASGKAAIVATRAEVQKLQGALAAVSNVADEAGPKMARSFRSGAWETSHIDAYRAEFERLRATYSPLYAASKRYETTLNEIANAERMGALTAVQANAARANAVTLIDGQADATRRLAEAQRQGDFQTTHIDAYRAEFERLRATYSPLYAASKRYETALEEVAQAERMGALTAAQANAARASAATLLQGQADATQRLAASQRMQTASLGNLFAQGNDVIMMVAAGQNPMQLALQQGTQISQVFQQMGVKGVGAFRLIGQSALMLLSPMNLITIGSIAAGAALVKWLSSGKDAVAALEKALQELESHVKAVRDATAALDSSNLDDLREQYGQLSEAVRDMLEAKRALAQFDALESANNVRTALIDEYADLEGLVAKINAAMSDMEVNPDASQLIAAWGDVVRREFGLSIESAQALSVAFSELEQADGEEARIAAYQSIREILTAAAEAGGGLNEQQAKLLRGILSAENAARLFAGIDLAAGVRSAADEARRLAGEITRAVNAANSLITSGAAQLEDAKIRNQLADDPVAMAGELARAQMRRTQEPLLKGAGPEDMAALGEQIRLAGEQAEATERLNQSYRKKIELQNGGTKASAAEHKAVTDLIDQLSLELAILKETDPVQQELLRHRQVLAAASDAERHAIEDLIAARIAEEAAIAHATELRDEFKSVTYDAIHGLTLEGATLAETFDNVARAIADAVVKAALLGEGPLAGLFGFTTDGGLLGGLGEILFPAHAEGGLITGRGDGTSDDILMTTPSGRTIWASSGEYMVNARATARNRALLERINAGEEIGAFAMGGAIAAGTWTPGAASPSDAPRANDPAGAVNNFYIQTQDLNSFAKGKARTARASQRFLADNRRYV